MNTDSMINVLQASGPHPDQALQLLLFGQFVGAWDVDITDIAPDGTKKEIKGEWHFGWALEGRAIVDVWIAPRRSLRSQAEHYDYGATLRFFDPTIQAWRVTWIGPERHVVLPFIGRQVDDEIVLEGSLRKGNRHAGSSRVLPQRASTGVLRSPTMAVPPGQQCWRWWDGAL